MKDSPINPKKDESGIARLINSAANKIAPALPIDEEYVLGMVQTSNYAAMKDSPIKRREEYYMLGTSIFRGYSLFKVGG